MKIQQNTKRELQLITQNGLFNYFVIKVKYTYKPGKYYIEKFGSGSNPMDAEKNALEALENELKQI